MAERKNDNTLEWWNNRYSIAGAKNIWSSQKRMRFYDMIATAIPKDSTTILDVGSGFGFGPEHLMGICDKWYVEGLDFSTKACAEAVVETHCVDIIIDNIPDTYDYVISAETMEHFSNPMAILDKMYQSARKAVIITVPYKKEKSTIHVSSFNENSFNKYPEVQIKLSPNKCFMLAAIIKPGNH